MNLLCKFEVVGIQKREKARRLTLRATRNVRFKPDRDSLGFIAWVTEPGGKFELTIDKPELFEQIDALAAGDFYYIELYPVPASDLT